MKIAINNAQKLSQIKDKFTRAFPFLKLEFFYPTKGNPFYKENQILQPDTKIGEIRHSYQAGYITFNPDTQVYMVEQQFLDSFGLYVQVFRKAGISWIQTSASDNQSLEELNKKGEELNTAFEGSDFQEDIHEQL